LGFASKRHRQFMSSSQLMRHHLLDAVCCLYCLGGAFHVTWTNQATGVLCNLY